ncbi:MAG: choice-of-anchor D domain-containing protein, partial [Pedobacter sp.]
MVMGVFSGLCLAAPVDLSSQVAVTYANERSTLDRLTRRITSTADITLTNRATNPIMAPLHGVITINNPTGAVTMPDALGGPGVTPYARYYYAPLAAGQLAPGEAITFSVKFVRQAGVTFTYNVAPYGAILVTSPTKLSFGVHPGNSVAGQAIKPAVTVTIQDMDSNLMPTATNAVTVTIGNNPANGTLSGTTTVNAVAGVATFPNLTLDKVGDGYTLTASATGLASANSNAFNVIAGSSASIIAISGTPQSTAVNTTFAVTLVAIVKDDCNNPVSGATVTFTAPTSGQSGTFTGGAATTTATTNAQGFASVSFTANGAAGSYNVAATVAGVSTPAIFALTNTMVQPAIQATPSPLSFGDVTVNTSTSLPLTITNSGAAELVVSSINGLSAPFSIFPPTSFTVATGASRQVNIGFAPTLAGAATGVITISSNASNQPTLLLNVSGNGVAPPGSPVIKAPAAIDFGPVIEGQNATKDVT